MLEIKDLHVNYGAVHALNGVSMTVNDGEIVSLIGANGAGKSTFLKTISGELDPTTGSIMLAPGERLSVLSQDHFKYE